MILEICTDQLEPALCAQAAGADRIELCGPLEVGGTTPSMALLKSVCAQVEIPVMVMIRPRAGNFQYSKMEIAMMQREIALAKGAEADGFVFGALTSDFEIDVSAMKALLEMTDGLPVTFHRAFDIVNHPFKALDTLIELKIPRLLTSGLATTAPVGTKVIKALVEKAGEDLAILAGSGVNPGNAKVLAEQTGVKELHFSGSAMQGKDATAHQGLGDVGLHPIFLEDKIHSMRQLFPVK